MLENRVVQFACGILYSHSFKLLDNWGAIADSILYNNKFFSAKYFPKISTQYTTSRSLSNDACGHSLQLTPNNLIYTHVVQDDFTSEFSEFVRRISEFLIPKIIEENSLIVRRIGIVFTCEISDQGIQSFAEKYFKPEFKEVTDFRFSKKESTVSGAIWSDKSDFINKIYTVGAIGENLTGISFDYQAHYVPLKSEIDDEKAIVIIHKSTGKITTISEESPIIQSLTNKIDIQRLYVKPSLYETVSQYLREIYAAIQS